MDPNAITYIRDMIYGNEDRVAEGNEGSTSQVDERELEDILNDEDDEAEEEEDKEEDKRVPPDLHKKEYNPSSIVKKEVTGGEIQSDELTPNEIKVSPTRDAALSFGCRCFPQLRHSNQENLGLSALSPSHWSRCFSVVHQETPADSRSGGGGRPRSRPVVQPYILWQHSMLWGGGGDLPPTAPLGETAPKKLRAKRKPARELERSHSNTNCSCSLLSDEPEMSVHDSCFTVTPRASHIIIFLIESESRFPCGRINLDV